jgi:hypothetical protein
LEVLVQFVDGNICPSVVCPSVFLQQRPRHWTTSAVPVRKPSTKCFIIIIIIGKDIISFMQGMYTYIPETYYVSKQYNVAAILSLLFMVPISLAAALALMYFYISTFRSIIIIIIIGKDTISFMQCIYTYIPQTNHVPKQHNVAAILSLLFMVPISLAVALALMYFYISTFRSIIIIIITIIITTTTNCN